MPSTPIKSCKKFVLSYKDSSNNTHQVGFYARDAYDCLILAREFNSYVHDHPRSVVRIQQKFWDNYESRKITFRFIVLAVLFVLRYLLNFKLKIINWSGLYIPKRSIKRKPQTNIKYI